MSCYIQYHNCDIEGVPLWEPLFNKSRLTIYTRRPEARAAQGTVFMIVGVGKPRCYYLWDTFEIGLVREVHKRSEVEFHLEGDGWMLCPPQCLTGKSFEAFQEACANFIGFRCIDDLPFCRKLQKFAAEERPPGDKTRIAHFLYGLLGALARKDPERQDVLSALDRFPLPSNGQLHALSIRQPHAEAIMRGAKPIEFRKRATHVRGPILIYASQGRYSAVDEAGMMADYRMRDISCDDLPRGVLIGTAELYDCREADGEFQWYRRKPERARQLVRPTKQPQPVWFNPF